VYRRRLPGPSAALFGLLLVLGSAASGPGIREALAEEAVVNEAEPRSSPPGVLLRSIAFPGWGQLENGRPYKAAAVFTVETGLLASAFIELRRADLSLEEERRASERGDVEGANTAYQQYLDRRDRALTRFWFGAFTILLSMIDAYADAHLRDFQTARIPERPRPAAAPDSTGTRPGGGIDGQGDRPLPRAPDDPETPEKKDKTKEETGSAAGLPFAAEPGVTPAILIDPVSARLGLAVHF
jgi:hypothetical protein